MWFGSLKHPNEASLLTDGYSIAYENWSYDLRTLSGQISVFQLTCSLTVSRALWIELKWRKPLKRFWFLTKSFLVGSFNINLWIIFQKKLFVANLRLAEIWCSTVFQETHVKDGFLHLNHFHYSKLISFGRAIFELGKQLFQYLQNFINAFILVIIYSEISPDYQIVITDKLSSWAVSLNSLLFLTQLQIFETLSVFLNQGKPKVK